MSGPRAEPRVDVLEASQQGGVVRHTLLGRPVQVGDRLAVRLVTDQGTSWLPVRFVPLHGSGEDRSQTFWRVTVETTHEHVELAIALPPTALLRWAVRARPLRADEATRMRETADEIDVAAAALRRALEAPSSGLGRLERQLLALEPGYRLDLTLLRELAGREGRSPADAELDWLDDLAGDLEQDVARYRRYADGGELSDEARRAVRCEGARLLAEAARLRELAATLEGP